MTEQELTARREIMLAFAETGAPPAASAFDPAVLHSLAEHAGCGAGARHGLTGPF